MSGAKSGFVSTHRSLTADFTPASYTGQCFQGVLLGLLKVLSVGWSLGEARSERRLVVAERGRRAGAVELTVQRRADAEAPSCEAASSDCPDGT